MKGLKSVKDVEAAVKAQNVLHKPDSTSALEFIWKKRVAEITKAPVVMKKLDFHKLTQFRKLCPPGTAEAVLKHVLSDWIDFAKSAEQMAALKFSPATPSIDFLLKNVQSAVILATPKPPPAPKVAKPAPKPVDAVQLLSPIPEPVVQKPQSLAEIWADDEDEEAE